MRRARNRTVPTRSAFPAARRNSPPRMLCRCVASAHESPAPANPFPCRSLPKSAPSNPPAPRGRPFQTRAASPLSARSSGRIVLRSSNAAAGRHFLFPAWPASTKLPRAAATLPIRIPSPDNPPRQAAALRLPFSPCPAPKPSAPALRFPARASSAETIARPGPAARRPAAPGPVARGKELRAPLRQTPPPRSDTWPPAPCAARILLLAHHPQSRWCSSFSFPYFLLPQAKREVPPHFLTSLYPRWATSLRTASRVHSALDSPSPPCRRIQRRAAPQSPAPVPSPAILS